MPTNGRHVVNTRPLLVNTQLERTMRQHVPTVTRHQHPSAPLGTPRHSSALTGACKMTAHDQWHARPMAHTAGVRTVGTQPART